MSDTLYAYETQTLGDWAGERPTADAEVLPWTSRRLAKVTRLRLVTDQGCPFFDVSYCWGVTTEGAPCRVALPFHQLDRKGWAGQIIAWAKSDRVHARNLGIFDAVSRIW